uniref:Uncharacterized protein n=1 Tax=Triticum urartu TaxID=4572 RepID=A0A8R7QTV3_TRIUA
MIIFLVILILFNVLRQKWAFRLFLTAYPSKLAEMSDPSSTTANSSTIVANRGWSPGFTLPNASVLSRYLYSSNARRFREILWTVPSFFKLSFRPKIITLLPVSIPVTDE